MLEHIEALETLTESMASRLQEAGYEEVEQFVRDREEIVLSIRRALQQNPEQASTYAERVQRLLRHDEAISGRIEALRSEAAGQLQKVDTAKTQRGGYDKAYTPDSLFFDRRK
ncbi:MULTISPECIES: flagellar protein FliT [Paenibacillus]|uniref:flagellar protein FliT n=1 Tax=Paenibacillus TaxID=44249 RepID=UPI0022B93516|nr:flagellar protein FliT [Paenibacillus caseinilyticus]MCZ8523603.1 flagellar protein FliT [Paenibacillus caseinilyticus]